MTDEKYEVNISIVVDKKQEQSFLDWLKADLQHTFTDISENIIITQKEFTNYAKIFEFLKDYIADLRK